MTHQVHRFSPKHAESSAGLESDVTLKPSVELVAHLYLLCIYHQKAHELGNGQDVNCHLFTCPHTHANTQTSFYHAGSHMVGYSPAQ